jgi:hypothetical protein
VTSGLVLVGLNTNLPTNKGNKGNTRKGKYTGIRKDFFIKADGKDKSGSSGQTLQGVGDVLNVTVNRSPFMRFHAFAAMHV